MEVLFLPFPSSHLQTTCEPSRAWGVPGGYLRTDNAPSLRGEGDFQDEPKNEHLASYKFAATESVSWPDEGRSLNELVFEGDRHE